MCVLFETCPLLTSQFVHRIWFLIRRGGSVMLIAVDQNRRWSKMLFLIWGRVLFSFPWIAPVIGIVWILTWSLWLRLIPWHWGLKEPQLKWKWTGKTSHTGELMETWENPCFLYLDSLLPFFFPNSCFMTATVLSRDTSGPFYSNTVQRKHTVTRGRFVIKMVAIEIQQWRLKRISKEK